MDIERQKTNGSTAKKTRRASQAELDASELIELGHAQELTRKFGPWSMFALSFSVLGTWSTLAQNMSTGITNGGPVTIMWGLVLVTICNLCVAVSLGELASWMPTALGQGAWVGKLWPTRTGRILSYATVWTNVFGWWTLTASQSAFMTEFILSLKLLYDPEWAPAGYGWVKFLLYLSITFLLTVINHTSCRRDKILPWIENFVGATFIMLFFVFALALLIAVGIKNGLQFQGAKFVFGTWNNGSGWPGGVTFFTGLIQSAYGLTAFDATIHMIEELPDATRTGPFIIWLSVLVGAITGWLFMAVCLASIQDLSVILEADYPFVQLCLDAIGLGGAATLLALFVISGIGQNIGLTTTSSRLTWSFARDGGIPFHKFFAVVNDTWKVPVRAVWGQAVIIGVVGVLYFFSDTVLAAIFSVSTIALTISYAIPIVVLLIVGREKIPKNTPFQLGKFGTTINIVSIVYCAVTTVFFFFPDGPKPAVADMNWAIAVFGCCLVIALVFWFVQGHKSYLETENSMFRIEMDNGSYDSSPREEVSQTTTIPDDSKRSGTRQRKQIVDGH